MTFWLKKLIRFYQKFISPGLPTSCRFYPSCSEYAYQCLAKKSLFQALILGTKRIVKCHPYHPGGFDPVE